MRKQLLVLLTFLFVSGGNVFAETLAIGDSNKTIPIPLMPKPIPTKPIPRQVVDCGIEAFYVDGIIILDFVENLGDADIVVTNLTTGDMWNGSVSGVCTTTILLSGDEGYYQVVIYTENEEYFGEFSL